MNPPREPQLGVDLGGASLRTTPRGARDLSRGRASLVLLVIGEPVRPATKPRSGGGARSDLGRCAR